MKASCFDNLTVFPTVLCSEVQIVVVKNSSHVSLVERGDKDCIRVLGKFSVEKSQKFTPLEAVLFTKENRKIGSFLYVQYSLYCQINTWQKCW